MSVNRFQKGKIYTIRSHQTDEIYIGSTTVTLSQRLAKHKNQFKCWKNGTTHYVTSFKLLEYGDAYIELLCNYPCNDRNELNKKEGEYIRSMDCVNKVIPGRTKKEYHEKNKEAIAKYKKEWYQDNKESVSKQQKEYNSKKVICDCGVELAKWSLAKHRRTPNHQQFISLLWWI